MESRLDRSARATFAVAIIAILSGVVGAHAAPPSGALPDRVTFASADGTTTLVGYVFKPEGTHAARTPAVVMMHGRAGAYSSAAKDKYDASTLSRRHQAWGRIWAKQGYLAILVDGFSPRGYPHGFPRFSYDSRPDTLNEITVRPLDAYGALAYLRTREDVVADRIAIHGWSNGGSATLATMSRTAPGISAPTPATGFRAGLVFYPACGLKGQFNDGILPYAPVRVFQGSADEEVSPRRCADLVTKSRALGGDIEFRLYPDATHDFDDPSPAHQNNDANADATEDVIARATEFLAGVLTPKP
jgi:dienelactone hydrolase